MPKTNADGSITFTPFELAMHEEERLAELRLVVSGLEVQLDTLAKRAMAGAYRVIARAMIESADRQEAEQQQYPAADVLRSIAASISENAAAFDGGAFDMPPGG